MPSTTTAARERYQTLIEATLRYALRDRAVHGAGSHTMENAVSALASRLGVNEYEELEAELLERIGVLATTPPDASIADGAGNARGTYRPLLMRLFAPLSGAYADAWATYRRAVLPAVRSFAGATGPLLAVDGAAIVARLFEALAIDAIEPDTSVADAFARVTSQQSVEGTFLSRTSADQLEPAWYHELAVLHAVDLYARQSQDVAAIAAVRRSARYHAAEVQPDHASSHPFGLAALLDDDEGIHLADMMLHAAGVQQPATMDAVSLVLLFDALDCGRRPRPA